MRFMKSLGMFAMLGVMPWAIVSAQAPISGKGAQKEVLPIVKVGSADTLTATTFAEYQKQIKPQPGESRWMEVPWFTDFHEARKKAAAEGKALLVYASGGATGIGAC